MLKKYSILLFSLLFFSCGIISLNVNGNKKYIVSTECGKIEISAKSVRLSRYCIKFEVLEGSFDLNMDNIGAFIEFSNTYIIKDLTVMYSSDRIQKQRKIEKGDIMEVFFFTDNIEESELILEKPTYNDKPVYGKPIYYTINLNPGSYLVCSGSQVIRDTIKIK